MVGAAVLLWQATNAGATAVFATIGAATPVAELPQLSSRLADAVLGCYAWNLLWIGCFVLVVAIWLNWRNNLTGYWLNLAVVSAVDLGLVVLLGHAKKIIIRYNVVRVACCVNCLTVVVRFISWTGLIGSGPHGAG